MADKKLLHINKFLKYIHQLHFLIKSVYGLPTFQQYNSITTINKLKLRRIFQNLYMYIKIS